MLRVRAQVLSPRRPIKQRRVMIERSLVDDEGRVKRVTVTLEQPVDEETTVRELERPYGHISQRHALPHQLPPLTTARLNAAGMRSTKGN